MTVAFVLINVRAGTDEAVASELRKVKEVREVYEIYGAYDILAKVEVEDMGRLKEVIDQSIRKIDGVKSTITMIVLSKYAK